jgi:hypothetical protein
MRYETVENITFTDVNRKSRIIKDMREYETQNIVAAVNVLNSRFIDEIATREEIYGDGSEFEIYKIVDQNIVKLFDARFNLEKIKKLEIPE